MNRTSFANEIVEGKIDDLASIVSLVNQDRFCRRIKTEFRKTDGDTSLCFEWGWRCFKAMRSLISSALLYVEGERARKGRYPDAMSCYALYYSLFHSSFSLLCMHPQIPTDQLRHISHTCLLNLIESKFVQTKILPKSFTQLLQKTRLMRELTSYFVPLGGLEASSSSDLRDVNLTFNETKKHLAYSFQLCNVLGSIYWKVKDNCTLHHKSACEANFKLKGEEIGDRIEHLVNYQLFDSAKHWHFIDEGDFDEEDAYMAARKFGLYRICPTPLLQFMTLEVGTEPIETHTSERVFRKFSRFICDLW